MLGSVLDDWGAAAGIVVCIITLGGIVLPQVRRARGRGRTRLAIDEVVIGVPEVKDARTGRTIQPERIGLIDRMDEMDNWRQTVDERLDEILTAVKPNGGETRNPGDTVLRLEKHVGTIADHLGIPLEEP